MKSTYIEVFFYYVNIARSHRVFLRELTRKARPHAIRNETQIDSAKAVSQKYRKIALVAGSHR